MRRSVRIIAILLFAIVLAGVAGFNPSSSANPAMTVQVQQASADEQFVSVHPNVRMSGRMSGAAHGDDSQSVAAAPPQRAR